VLVVHKMLVSPNKIAMSANFFIFYKMEELLCEYTEVVEINEDLRLVGILHYLLQLMHDLAHSVIVLV
jgi:hypothetical protein